MDFSRYRFAVSDAYADPAFARRRGDGFSCCAGVSHAARLAEVYLVRDAVCVFGFRVWNSSAPYVQRETLLVSRNAVRRNSVWAVCEPESLCGIRGAGDSSVACAADPRKSAAGTEIYHRLVRALADRRAFDVGVARRRCGVWSGAALCAVVCGAAEGGQQAPSGGWSR